MNALNKKNVLVIGTGTMGEAVLQGILRQKTIARGKLFGMDIDAEKLARKAKKIGFKQCRNISDISKTDIIILAVKPQRMAKLIENIREYLDEQKLIISVAAGITTRQIEKQIGRNIPVVRAMPNTPAVIGRGMIVIACGSYTCGKHESVAQELLGSLGMVISLPEKHMNAVTAVSGSGPAYVFYLAEAMIQAGLQLGLDRYSSTVLTRQTLAGASELFLHSDSPPESLRKKVTSPGGTTEAAVKWMDEKGVKYNLVEAIKRAKLRGDELAKQ